MAKNTICLWYDKDAEAAARFYAQTFLIARWVPSIVRRAITRRQGRRRADRRIHGVGILASASTAAPRSSRAKHFRSRSPPTIRKRRIATGTPSSATAARRARAAGARTSGACPGRSRRAYCSMRWPPAATETRIRRDDDDAEDRHREDRGRAAWLRLGGQVHRTHAKICRLCENSA